MKLSLTKFFVLLFIISIPLSSFSQRDKDSKKGNHISFRGIFGGDKTERVQKRKNKGAQRKSNKKLRKKKKSSKKQSSYSVDKKLKNRNSFFKKLFNRDKEVRKKRKEDKAIKKQDKKELKARLKSGKKEKKAIKKYQKTVNKPDYVHTEKSAYKKMKKTKRAQNRLVKGKNRDPWIKRIFRKGHKTDKPKRDKAERSRRHKEPFYKRIFRNKKKRKIH